MDQDEFGSSALPPVPVPGAADLLSAAEASPVVREIREFVLGLGEGQPPSTTSIACWATACGLVRTVDGVQVPVAEEAALLDQPVELWDRAFRAFEVVALDLLAGDGDELSKFAQGLLPLMALIRMSLYRSTTLPMELELLHLSIFHGLQRDLGPIEDLPGESGRWRADLTLALATLARLGAVDLGPITDRDRLSRLAELSGSADPDPTLVGLTPIAFWSMNRILRTGGLEAPVIGELADEDLSTLCTHLLLATFPTVDNELAAWTARRSPVDAATEAAEFLTKAESPLERQFALTVLAGTGESGLAAAKGVRDAGGIAGAVTAFWLFNRRVLDVDSMPEQEFSLGVTDHYAAVYLSGDLVDVISAREVDDQLSFIAHVAAAEHPDRLVMLDVIGREHPEAQVAKAARQARFRLSSGGH